MNQQSNIMASIAADRAAKARALDERRGPLRNYAHMLSDDQIAEMMFVCVEELIRRMPEGVCIADAIDAINDEVAAFAREADAARYFGRFS